MHQPSISTNNFKDLYAFIFFIWFIIFFIYFHQKLICFDNEIAIQAFIKSPEWFCVFFLEF